MAITAEELGRVLQDMHDAKLENIDPFRPYIQFLVGLLGFCAVVIAAVFAALPEEPAKLVEPAPGMLGGVLIWMTLTAVIASFFGLIIQVIKSRYMKAKSEKRATPKVSEWRLFLMCLAPVVTGFVAVSYCVRGGAAMVAASTQLPGFWAAVCMMW
jgi:hypothetical protein